MCHPYIESTTALSDIYIKQKHLLVNEKKIKDVGLKKLWKQEIV